MTVYRDTFFYTMSGCLLYVSGTGVGLVGESIAFRGFSGSAGLGVNFELESDVLPNLSLVST